VRFLGAFLLVALLPIGTAAQPDGKGIVVDVTSLGDPAVVIEEARHILVGDGPRADKICITFHNAERVTAIGYTFDVAYFGSSGNRVATDRLAVRGTFATGHRSSWFDSHTHQIHFANCVTIHYPAKRIAAASVYASVIRHENGKSSVILMQFKGDYSPEPGSN
jgi:hypothetical protein